MSRLAEALHGHFVLEAIGPIGCGHSKDEPEIYVAEFIREQLLSDEAVEKVARGLFDRDMGDGPAAAKWDNVAEGIRQNYRNDARAAITALLGEES